jgi:hypothetical protein
MLFPVLSVEFDSEFKMCTIQLGENDSERNELQWQQQGMKDNLLFDYSQLLLSKEVFVNPSPVPGKPSFS